MKAATALLLVKLVHTFVWALFAGLIVAIPLASFHGRHAIAAWSAVAVAARYTDERHDSFDIYLPPWLARHNKVIFGTLYLAGIAFAFAHWALAAD